MKITKIKSILIWALVLVNLFFLAVILRDHLADRSGRKELLENLARLFEQHGVALDAGSIGEGIGLQEYTISRNQDAERALAEALLGNTVKIDEGGSIYEYKSEKGTAVFAGGAFEVTINPGVWLAGAGPVRTVRDVLKTLKIEAASLDLEKDGSSETVTAVCAVGGYPIFNCSIKLHFKDGWFLEFSGMMAASLTPAAGKTDMSSPATALVRFLSDIKNKKIYCTKIHAVTPGYYMPPFFSDDDSLIPVWRIQTDAGTFYRDAVTGEIAGAREKSAGRE